MPLAGGPPLRDIHCFVTKFYPAIILSKVVAVVVVSFSNEGIYRIFSHTD